VDSGAGPLDLSEETNKILPEEVDGNENERGYQPVTGNPSTQKERQMENNHVLDTVRKKKIAVRVSR
jgi:hypothetical protein